MPSIRLTPQATLRWETGADTQFPRKQHKAAQQFAIDWRSGLFALGAQKEGVTIDLTLRYWRGFSSQYITRLCLLPPETLSPDIEALSEAELSPFLLGAPPMQGGEYLRLDSLRELWKSLDTWAKTMIEAEGTLADFLRVHAPDWHQVGRVCFHLAENKKDPARPFAFMATYTTGLNAAGKARHLPMRKALEISFGCSCPDDADMCKHIAAVLYGIAHRLDHEPDLLFYLRQVDPQELIDADIALPSADIDVDAMLGDHDLGDIFGVDMDFDFGDAEESKPAPKKSTKKPKAKTSTRAKKSNKPKAAPDDFAPTGAEVARLRELFDYSAEEFGEQVGVSEEKVYEWEATDGPIKIAAAPKRKLKLLW